MVNIQNVSEFNNYDTGSGERAVRHEEYLTQEAFNGASTDESIRDSYNGPQALINPAPPETIINNLTDQDGPRVIELLNPEGPRITDLVNPGGPQALVNPGPAEGIVDNFHPRIPIPIDTPPNSGGIRGIIERLLHRVNPGGTTETTGTNENSGGSRAERREERRAERQANKEARQAERQENRAERQATREANKAERQANREARREERQERREENSEVNHKPEASGGGSFKGLIQELIPESGPQALVNPAPPETIVNNLSDQGGPRVIDSVGQDGPRITDSVNPGGPQALVNPGPAGIISEV